ncbi:MAG: hypothetical protein ACLQUT_06745 [Thermoleophilia bacterium]
MSAQRWLWEGTGRGAAPAADGSRRRPAVVRANDLAQMLGDDEPRDGHGFARLSATRSDFVFMAEMLARERSLVRGLSDEPAGGRRLGTGANGRRRELLVLPDVAALLAAIDVSTVGFFGHLRKGIGHAILFELEATLEETFSTYAAVGLLSYYDLGSEHGRFGNLVLFSRPDGPELWHANQIHQQAVAVAARHYEYIRLHHGHLPGPLLGNGELAIERTSYLDYRGERLWRGARKYSS